MVMAVALAILAFIFIMTPAHPIMSTVDAIDHEPNLSPIVLLASMLLVFAVGAGRKIFHVKRNHIE